MGFKIIRKTDLQKQCLAKTSARRKANVGGVAVTSAAAAAPILNDLLPTLQIDWRQVADIKPPERRVRKADADHVAATVRAIAQFGFVSPITVRGDKLIDGHIRLLAAQHHNLEKVPCIDVSHLSQTSARALAISLNRLGETGQWDLPELRVELAELELEGFDLTVTGFSLPELDIIMLDEPDTEAGGDPEPPAPPDVAVSQLGDLWLLDSHRVVCGDALHAVTYQTLLDGLIATAVLTDPPYNVKIAGNVSGLGKVKHGEFKMGVGEWSREEFQTFLTDVLKLSADHLIAGGVSSWFMDWRSIDLLTTAARAAELTRYVDVIVRRWEELTGLQAVHAESGLSFREIAAVRSCDDDQAPDD